MAGDRSDSHFELGSLIQGFDTQNMIFWKNVQNKNGSQDFFWGTWIFQIIFTELMFKEAGVRIDFSHID